MSNTRQHIDSMVEEINSQFSDPSELYRLAKEFEALSENLAHAANELPVFEDTDAYYAVYDDLIEQSRLCTNNAALAERYGDGIAAEISRDNKHYSGIDYRTRGL